MSSGILISLVLMKDGMDMNLSLVSPLHEHRDNLGRLAWTVDVVHEITDAVNYHKSSGIAIELLFLSII